MKVTQRHRAARAVADAATEIFGPNHDIRHDVSGLLASLTESEMDAFRRVMCEAFHAGQNNPNAESSK